MRVLSVSKDFSCTPGGRYMFEGPYSGESFRVNLLYPELKEAMNNNEKLTIDLSGCYGFASCFLEEAFGGLVRKNSLTHILDHIVLETHGEEGLENTVKEIRKYITEAEFYYGIPSWKDTK